MKYYYDNEFLYDGRTIDLISIGVVCEDGREYYAVNKDMPWARVVRHQWLLNNVVPSLPMNPRWASPVLDRDHSDVKKKIDIRRELMTFFIAGNAPVELWGWFAAFDHVCLAQLFGTMTDWPSTLPMWTNDLRQETERLGCYSALPGQKSGRHHALEDARWNKLVDDFLVAHER